jgi:hypothetical protein
VKWALRWGQRWPRVDFARYGPREAEAHRGPLAPKLRAFKMQAVKAVEVVFSVCR